ncbi:U4/U6.U5 snRNP associated protein [Orbilia oligospora]|uniref:U4/U6.U5 snRNP associated protein n=1 Tax=Orbilia oligospora TaxID=2813651 RepID=A0A7C8NPN0_ORBOL|nr:U4/U6.U5 snRNP associated protein [Orbilia oligospora]
MSKPKGVYDNAATGDTSFRRTWDREEYAQKAAERQSREAKERKERYEAKLGGKKYIPKSEVDANAGETKFDDSRMIEARRSRIRLDENLNKVQIVPLGTTGGRRGKGPGYYCEACDLNFTNSLEYVEHLNSKQHLNATGQTDVVERATLEMVRERLIWLKQRKQEQDKAEEFDLAKRLAERKTIEEQERLEKKERKRIKKEETRQKKVLTATETSEQTSGVDVDAAMMARMMGFGGFTTPNATNSDEL